MLLAATSTGVWRSADAGRAWVASTAGIVGSTVPTLEGSARAQYAFSRTGFSVSRDGGLTWTWKALPAMSRISQLVVDPADDHSIFAATEVGLYASRDDGDTWTRVHAGSIRAVAAGSGARSSLLILTPKSGVGIVAERSDDGGRGWSELPSEAFASEQPAAIEIDPFDHAHLVVSAFYATFQTYDAGASWSRIREFVLGARVTFFGTTAGLMLASSSGRTWTSVDSGRTWSAPDVYSGTDPFTPDPALPGRRYAVGESWLLATDADGSVISYSIAPVFNADRTVRPVVLEGPVGRRVIVARPGGVATLDIAGPSLAPAGAKPSAPATSARARHLRASGPLRVGAVLVCRPFERGKAIWTRDRKTVAVGARYRVRRADRGHRIACLRPARKGRPAVASTPRLVPRRSG